MWLLAPLLLVVGAAGELPGAQGPLGPPEPGQTEARAEIERLGARFLVQGCTASWAPDGKRLVFCDGAGLKLLDLKTRKVHSLTEPGENPVWSPGEGQYIAFCRGVGTDQAIWLLSLAGGEPRQLAKGGGAGWFADGKRLFFHSPERSTLKSIRADQPDAQPTDVVSVASSYPALSPDGRQVAYWSGNQLLVDGQTGETILKWPMAEGAGACPQWSPDGRQLGFAGQGVDGVQGLWILEVNSQQAVRVAGGDFAGPAWSADGSKLAFDLRLPAGPEIWVLETKRLESLEPLAIATDCYTVPEAAAELFGPVHRPQGKRVFVELAGHANRKLAESTGTIEDNHLQELPQGEHAFAGVEFRIGESVIQLASTRLPDAPQRVEGIPIHRRVITLSILHASQWCGPQFEVPRGKNIGTYQVRYADGSDATVPIVCGEDVHDWWVHGPEKPVTRGQVVWAGRNPAVEQRDRYLRLYLTAWKNPHPEKTVATIDYASAMTTAGPFCVAMTVEAPGPCRKPAGSRAAEPKP